MNRAGVTLIEIMVSVLILSIGMLGVIAAIPYGGYQMEKMRDSDFTAMVGRNAMAMIEANQWHLPDNWLFPDEFRNLVTNYAYVPAGMPASLATNGQYFIKWNNNSWNINLYYPIMLDGIGAAIEGNSFYARPVGVFDSYTGSGTDVFPTSSGYIRVNPKRLRSNVDKNMVFTGNTSNLQNDIDDNPSAFLARMDYIFRTHDDLNYGIPGKKIEPNQTVKGADLPVSEGAMRPVIGSSSLEYPDESDRFPGAICGFEKMYDAFPDFTGSYSWMAMLQPRITESDSVVPVSNAPISKINAVDVDVAVFKNRLDSVPSFFGVQRIGVGLNGGTFRLFNNTKDGDTVTVRNLAANGSNPARSTSLNTMSDLAEALKSTSYILLEGNDWTQPELITTPPAVNTYAYRKFAQWYKVANFSEPYFDGTVEYIDVTLIGPDCPQGTNWTNTVRALVFPNVIGVYKKTIAVREN